MMQQKITTRICIIGLIALFSSSKTIPGENGGRFLELVEKTLKEKEIKIRFLGRVVDAAGRPLSNVRVEAMTTWVELKPNGSEGR